MNRKTRTEVLVRGPMEGRRQLAERILARYPAKILEAPSGGLVMVKARETAQKSLFYLGEVYVTECKVSIQNHIGIGVLQGDDPEGAFELAVIDAAFNARLKETKRWEAVLTALKAHLEMMQLQEDAKILSTMVSFDTMDV